MVREAGRVDLRAVVRMCPGATEWDLSEAVRHLLREGLIARSSPPSSGRSEWAGGRGEFQLTAIGLRHLGVQ
jgi:hypothetical protein